MLRSVRFQMYKIDILILLEKIRRMNSNCRIRWRIIKCHDNMSDKQLMRNVSVLGRIATFKWNATAEQGSRNEKLGTGVEKKNKQERMGMKKYILLAVFIFAVALTGNALLHCSEMLVQMPDDHTGAKLRSKNTTTTATTPQEKQNAILLSSFMRSGSSVIGDIFNRHPDAFYMFEPLHEMVPLLPHTFDPFLLILVVNWHWARTEKND